MILVEDQSAAETPGGFLVVDAAVVLPGHLVRFQSDSGLVGGEDEARGLQLVAAEHLAPNANARAGRVAGAVLLDEVADRL